MIKQLSEQRNLSNQIPLPQLVLMIVLAPVIMMIAIAIKPSIVLFMIMPVVVMMIPSIVVMMIIVAMIVYKVRMGFGSAVLLACAHLSFTYSFQRNSGRPNGFRGNGPITERMTR